MREADPARCEVALGQAERNYERLVELLAEMSDLWRLEAGQAVFNRQSLLLVPLLHRAAESAAARLNGECPIELDTTAGSDVRVVSDPVRLERACIALMLTVARRTAGTSHPVVHVSVVHAPAQRVRLVFAEARAGAPPDDAPRHAVDEFESGLGLALPIARRVVEADGGTLSAVGDGRPFILVAQLPVTC
jgi:C4-dicarboxylate-specific signal transduction histidine kinase